MVFFASRHEMTCEQAQLLMILHMKDDPDLTQAQREAFEAHLMVCSACGRANVREGIRSNVIFRQGYADGADGAPLRRWLGERRPPGVDSGIALQRPSVSAGNRVRNQGTGPACRSDRGNFGNNGSIFFHCSSVSFLGSLAMATPIHDQATTTSCVAHA